jgi:hypothetical protein
MSTYGRYANHQRWDSEGTLAATMITCMDL